MTKKGILILSILLLYLFPLLAQLKYANILFEEQNFIEAIPLYERVLEKKGESIEVIENLAYCYKVTNDYKNAEKYFAKAVTFEEANASSYLYYGQLLKNNNKINQARDQFIEFSKKKPGSLIGKLMIRSCKDIMNWSSQPVEYQITNLKKINSEFNDIGPMPYKQGLVFTSEKKHLSTAKKKNEEYPTFSLYYTEFTNGIPGEITSLFGKTSGDDFEGPAYFNQAQDLVFYNKVFDTRRFLVNQIKIYYAKMENGVWGSPKSFYLNSNEYTITNPVLSYSGDTLFFSSDKEGGYGGMDIYYSVKHAENEWGKAINLGPLVNTEGIEIPSFYNNKNELFFSSNFHPGYGGFDVFSTKWDGITWSSPENLKSPLNSTKDELGFISTGPTGGYFSSNRDGGLGQDDIYLFSLMDTTDQSNYTTVSGIFEYQNLPLENITLNLLDENDVLIQSAVTNEKGEFEFNGIPPAANYQIIVDEAADKIPDGSKLYLTNSENKKVRLLSQIQKGLFKFEALKVDEYDDLPLLEEEDDLIPRLTILGEVYNKLSADLPPNMEVYLLDDEQLILATAKTDENGKFKFTNIKLSEEFIFRLSQNDPNLELNILNEKKELIVATTRNESGDFVFLTNLQKSVKNPTVAGVFKYGKLPATGVRLNLMDENDELLQYTKTDEKGEFKFDKLKAGNNYSVQVDPSAGKVPKNAAMYLRDEQTGRLLPVAKSGTGTFNFKTLAYDEAEDLALIEEIDDSNAPRTKLMGEIYHKLSMDLPDDLEIYMLDDDGNIIASAKTTANGKFEFSDVAQRDEFLLRISKLDPNLEIKIINQQGQLLGVTSRKENGDFSYLTNLQKSVKNPGIAGVFKYGKLPASDVRLNLMGEDDELLQYTKTDEKGEFKFDKLKAGKNYSVQVDPSAGEIPDNAEMFLKDRHTGMLLPVAKNGKGTFNFQTLAYDEAEDLALIEEVDDSNAPRTKLMGEIYHKLSMDLPDDLEIYMLDDDGNIIASAKTTANGKFEFSDVAQRDEFLLRISKLDPNLEIKIINQQGQLLGVTSRKENGDFSYLTNLQKSVKNPGIAGVFKYGKLPASDVRLNLMGEDDELLQYTKTDEKGEFKFDKLKAGKNYSVQVDPSAGEIPDNAEMFLKDRHTGMLLPVAKNGKGTFNFQTLAYDEAEDLALIEEVDDSNAPRTKLMGEIYHKLSMDLPDDLEIYMLDDDGNIIASAKTTANGKFEFSDVAQRDEFLLRISKLDPNLEIKIINQQGQLLGVTSRKENGDFSYLTNLQKSVKNPGIAGVFKYGKLPASDVRLNLMGEDDELLQYTKTDEKGEFKFDKLKAGKNYSVQVDPSAGEIPDNAEMFLKDRHTGMLLPVAKNGKGTFNFQTLAYDEAEDLALIEDVDETPVKSRLLREINYQKLPLDLPEGLTLFLTDDDGNILSKTIVDKNHKFKFEKLAMDDEELLRLFENDADLKLKVVSEHGNVVALLSKNEKGQLSFEPPTAKPVVASTIHTKTSISEGATIYYDFSSWS